MLKVAPSLLAADFMHLQDSVEFLNSNADIIHLDVMDGTLVPNISFGFSVIEPLAKVARIPMDVHLMVVEPQRWFRRLAELGADMISFHLEAARLAGTDAARLLSEIRSYGARAGLVINPDLPVESLYPYIGSADFMLIMSVFAGFGGQSFIPESVDKVAALRKEIDRQGAGCLIEVDGGVNAGNARILEDAGADIVVAGSSVFRSEDKVAAIRAIRGI